MNVMWMCTVVLCVWGRGKESWWGVAEGARVVIVFVVVVVVVVRLGFWGGGGGGGG